MRYRRLALGLLAFAACAHDTRFALRGPVTREDDARPISHKPRRRPELNAPGVIDNGVLRPVTRVWLLERPSEAANVNALDEVPDSTWFTNRAITAATLRNGACDAVPEPVLPFTVLSRKQGGMTAGFVATDATGRRFALKFDQDETQQPGLSTAADAIVSRIYWSIGFYTPCNRVANVRLDDLRMDPRATETDSFGVQHPLDASAIAGTFASRRRRVDGTIRIGVSHFIEGEPLGPWAVEGRRDDDPNDRIPHEQRRELRGERLLAAWVSHWDAREANAFDTWIRVGNMGFVRHYQIDFGDALGVRPLDVMRADRQGFEYTIPPGTLLVDFATFGAVHRPWDDVPPDASLPMLGVAFDVAHFDPAAWVPTNPSPRFDAATPQDIAWMARRLARIGPDEIAVALESGRFDDPRAAARLASILRGRRERALRASFEHVSPLADLAVHEGRLCATDLATRTGVSGEGSASYRATIARVNGGPRTLQLDVARGGALCVQLPPNDANATAPDDSASRYVVVEIHRVEGRRHTRLGTHLYDLGARGWGLAGIERPDD